MSYSITNFKAEFDEAPTVGEFLEVLHHAVAEGYGGNYLAISIDGVDKALTGELDSCRGEYYNLAAEHNNLNTVKDLVTVEEFILKLDFMVGQIIEGYKGGQYLVTYDTYLFIDNYSHYRGMRVKSIESGLNKLIIKEEEY